MAKHTPFDEQLRWVRAWRDSGESQVAFAHRHELRLPTLRSWIHRHRSDDRPGGFLQVELASARPTFAVHVAGAALIFDAPPPPDWFAAVLRGVARC